MERKLSEFGKIIPKESAGRAIVGKKIPERDPQPEQPHAPSPIGPNDIPFDPEKQDEWERKRRDAEGAPPRGWVEVDFSVKAGEEDTTPSRKENKPTSTKKNGQK